MLTLILGGEVYSPEYLGRSDLLLGGDRLIHVGPVDMKALSSLAVDVEEVDASGNIVVPGFVDPHEHLIGAGGEQGFGSRMPEVPFSDLALSGVTTAVGCLGTDTVTRNPLALLGRVRQLQVNGVSAYLYTGGFPVPTPTITGSVTRDIVVVPEVVGVGEIAISDYRSSQPSLDELARIVSEAIVGGMVSGKAGVVHFHVGPGSGRLSPMRALLDEREIPPKHLYATHINRTQELIEDAADLARRGIYVDADTVDGEISDWLRRYVSAGGPFDRFTVSSDAHTPNGTPSKLFESFRACAISGNWPIEEVLKIHTSNPAHALGLRGKGRIARGADADLLVLDPETLRLIHVFAGGKHLVREGRLTFSGEASPDLVAENDSSTGGPDIVTSAGASGS